MDKWNRRTRPVCLEKRFEFDSYQLTREFLDRLGQYCEKVNRFPDMSFGKTYVNITVRPEKEDKDVALNDEDQKFTAEIDRLVDDSV